MGGFTTKSKSAGDKSGVLRRPAAGKSAASQSVSVRESKSTATKMRGAEGNIATKSKSADGKPGVLGRPAAGNPSASQTVSVMGSKATATKKRGAKGRGRGSDSEPAVSHAAIARHAAAQRASAKRLRDDSSLSTEEVDPAPATQSGIAKGRRGGQVDGSDPYALGSHRRHMYWVRVVPTGKKMREKVRKSFRVLLPSDSHKCDLRCEIYRLHPPEFLPYRNQCITHMGKRVRSKVVQDVLY